MILNAKGEQKLACDLDLLADRQIGVQPGVGTRTLQVSRWRMGKLMTKDQTAAWGRFVIRKRAFVLTYALFWLALLSIFLPQKGPVSGTFHLAAAVVGVVASIACFALYSKVLLCKCPRCGKHISQNFPRQRPFTNRCLNCGFPMVNSE